MNLFLENGHLSEQCLQALMDGTLDEAQRLQVAEHLSSCEQCLMRYTDLLTEEVCQQPPRDMVLPVMHSVRSRRLWRVVTGRYATAAAAVMLTFTLWSAGAFPILKAHPPARRPSYYAANSFHLKQVFWSVSDGFNDMVNELSRGLTLAEQKPKATAGQNEEHTERSDIEESKGE